MDRYQKRSHSFADSSEGATREIRGNAPEIEHRRLHLDDNLSVLAQYNDEKAIVDYWRTKFVP